MDLSILKFRSLKTRVTLFTLAIFVAGMWSLAFYASRMLRADMQRLAGEQQFSTVSFMAAEVNGELNDRFRLLGKVAARVTPAMLGDTAALQAFLEERLILEGPFNGGTFATGIDGTAMASIPRSVGRIGVNYMDRDFIAAALRDGTATIGRPVVGEKLRVPIFVMAVPILDARGNVIGALAGVTDLSLPNFLDKVSEGRYGKTGAYLLNAPQYRLTVVASDRSRTMQPLPAPGVNKMLDRYIQGFEGYGIVLDSRGVEMLNAAKGIPVAGWFIAVVLPTAEAFAPVRAMQQRMLLTTILLTLLAGGLTWWMLRRQLAPMLTTVKTLATLSDTNQPPQPLPITSQDEIGDLIGGFNRLLETLGKREHALKENEQSLRVSEAQVRQHNELLARQKANLEATLGRVKRLEGMIAICMQCKKIRAENNDWHQLERYLGEHSDTVFSHGICPECLDKEMNKLE